MNRTHSQAAYLLSALIASASIIWLSASGGWEPLIASLTGVLGMVLVTATGSQTENPQRDPSIRTFLLGEKRERDRYLGRWNGAGEDVNLPGEDYAPNTYEDAFLDLHAQDGSIGGQFGLVVVNEEQNLRDNLRCDVDLVAVCGDFIMLRFAMVDRNANHFGVLLLRTSDAAAKLHGYFLKKRVFGDPRFGFAEFSFSKAN